MATAGPILHKRGLKSWSHEGQRLVKTCLFFHRCSAIMLQQLPHSITISFKKIPISSDSQEL